MSRKGNSNDRILLVEPEYSNKYPPLGLMKLSTYHKNKKDRVEFYKGKAPYTILKNVDRVYITTLFTFYYDITIDTIKYYMDYVNHDNIYIGGIASTLLYDDFKKDSGLKNIITGQLVSSSIIGYSDEVNIDELPLDYDILDDISYKYPAGDNFFIYTTRGCPRKCEFCAVSTLEPFFKETNHITNQITSIREKYGDKRNVLIMDNNILFSKKLKNTVNDLLAMGFQRDVSNYVYPNPLDLLIKKIMRRRDEGNSTIKLEQELTDLLLDFAPKVKGQTTLATYQSIVDKIDTGNVVNIVLEYRDILIEITDKYRFKKPLQRYVDFNQGADARLLTSKKMKILSEIAIKPFRLAYDDIEASEAYYKAFEIAYESGVRYFSNYILYNYIDRPEDLWKRLYNTILMFEKKDDIQAFSFPMKYAPIQKSRDFVGQHWNKKYLSAINVIINVTNGSVAKEKDFFFKAYGQDEAEFIEILTMPNEFIKYRFFFEGKGLIREWQNAYRALSNEAKDVLINILSNESSSTPYPNLAKVLKFYKVTKYVASKTNFNSLEEEIQSNFSFA